MSTLFSHVLNTLHISELGLPVVLVQWVRPGLVSTMALLLCTFLYILIPFIPSL